MTDEVSGLVKSDKIMRIERNLSLLLVWNEHPRSISIFWIFMICLIGETDDCDNKFQENPSP